MVAAGFVVGRPRQWSRAMESGGDLVPVCCCSTSAYSDGWDGLDLSMCQTYLADVKRRPACSIPLLSKQPIKSCKHCSSLQPTSLSSAMKLKFVVLILLLRLAFSPCLLVQAKANEVEIDWSINSHLFNKGDRLTTKYIRMKDILHFRCPPVISFNIHIVTPESALFCRLPSYEEVFSPASRITPTLRTPIGRCAPNTGDPKVNVRPFSPLPDRPVFQEGRSYFLITTSTGTADGVENREGGLCESHGMRLRLVVLGSSLGGMLNAGSNRAGDEEVTNLVDIFHHLKPAHLSSPSTTTIPPPSVPEFNNKEEEIDFPEPSPKPSNTTTSSVEPLKSGTNAEEQKKRNSNRSKLLPRDHRTPSSIAALPADHLQQPDNSHKHVDGEGGFPAVLTLEENGRKKKILVHNSRQLQQEINYANERNSRVQQLEVFKSSEEDRSGGGSIRQINLPEYSISGKGTIEAIPAKLSPTSSINAGSGSVNPVGLGRREAAVHHVQGRSGLPIDNTDQASQEVLDSSSMHRQLPFIYVVGYNEDGTEQHLPSTAASPWKGHSLSLLTTLCIPLLPILGCLLLAHWR